MNEENGFRIDRYYTTATPQPTQLNYATVTSSPSYYNITTSVPSTSTLFYPNTVISNGVEIGGIRWEEIGEIDGRTVRVSPQGMLFVEEEAKQKDFEPVEEGEFEEALKELLE